MIATGSRECVVDSFWKGDELRSHMQEGRGMGQFLEFKVLVNNLGPRL